MAVTLEEFVKELEQDVAAFKADWLANHASSPDQYPLELPDNNAGAWSEMFTDFMHRQRQ